MTRVFLEIIFSFLLSWADSSIAFSFCRFAAHIIG